MAPKVGKSWSVDLEGCGRLVLRNMDTSGPQNGLVDLCPFFGMWTPFKHPERTTTPYKWGGHRLRRRGGPCGVDTVDTLWRVVYEVPPQRYDNGRCDDRNSPKH